MIIPIILFLFFFFIFLFYWMSSKNPYDLAETWNGIIAPYCDDTKHKDTGIPAFQYAENSTDIIKRMHRRILSNHDQIALEINQAMNENIHRPFIDIDSVQAKQIGTRSWKNIWIRFFGKTTGYIPTLSRIINDYSSDIPLAYISIFEPGTILPRHAGINKGILRYHYGVDIPDGDTGLEINQKYVKWENRRGFVWDDTYPHMAWNRTDKLRIIIFVDVLRPLPIPLNWMNEIFHSLIENNDDIVRMKKNINN